MAEIPGLDVGRLRTYLDAVAPQFSGELSATLIAGGRSNLTYFIANRDLQYVLRRPPLGHVLTTAHDMVREYRVISALSGSEVPVPVAILLCEDESVIGAPFYLMSKVDGTVYRTKESTALLSAGDARKVSYKLVDTLALLHGVDPVSVGLENFGKVNGFLERQSSRWQKQLASSKSREIKGINELATGLDRAIPTTKSTGVLHGDYRLDNCIIDADMRLAGIVDWEMSTLGDCLSDVGLFVVYWNGVPGDDSPINGGISLERGFPSALDLLERYAVRTGSDLNRINWYIAFGYFKLAVILEGIHFRFSNGQTVGTGFAEIGNWVAPLVAAGLEALGNDGVGK
ncbi:MAG TPA: phosphotransferase family protein [Candidatus Nanopelagicaceae bacterium]|nr:phosphotransferase family protein [Candidatus Nanopelagicaceae bacterium]